MAAPMRENPLDGGHRPKVADTRPTSNNFEYDDNEWDIGIGDLIIDLDADIEKTAGPPGMASTATKHPPPPAATATTTTTNTDHSATLDKGLKMKIKRTKPGTKTSEAKHEIVKADNDSNGTADSADSPSPSPRRTAAGVHRRDKTARTTPAPSPVPEVNGTSPSPVTEPDSPTPPPPPQAESRIPKTLPASPPPAKKQKTDIKESADVCVGTSVATITEPDCLGPCEPGTSVTLEGIVWHETEGGVLVVNVTWRGKTYVGTLLDCTRHDWAPPRFCDSPTEELDARTPKGRAKRGRAAIPGGDLSNFTETRSSVHSKLRNGGAKGRRGGPAGTPVVAGTREVPSPPPVLRAEPSPGPPPTAKRKTRSPEDESPAGKRRPPPSPPASPVLLECPEPNCSKKYKHVNGLKYHRSHAHGVLDEDELKDPASASENEESNIDAPSPVEIAESPGKVTPTVDKDEIRSVTIASPITCNSTEESKSRATTPSPSPVSINPQPPPSPVALTVVTAEPESNLIKPGVLRFGPREDFSPTNFASKQSNNSGIVTPPTNGTAAQSPQNDGNSSRSFPLQPAQLIQIPSHQSMCTLPMSNYTLSHPIQTSPQLDNSINNPMRSKVLSPVSQNSQFKVKPTAALMPTDDKKLQDNRILNKAQNFKKTKSRKSPAGSPLPPDAPNFTIEQTNTRDDVQSPAYSDISDDNAPVIETDSDKNKILGDKKPECPTLNHTMPPGYGMYPFFGQSPYLIPSVQNPTVIDPSKIKEENRSMDGKSSLDKDIKREGLPENMQKNLYYPFSYIPGYPYNIDPSYSPISMIPEDKLKEQQERDRERCKESPSPAEHSNGKSPAMSSPQQQPQPLLLGNKKSDKDNKHANENHQILKESIEMKSQMNPFLYQRHSQAQQASHQHIQNHQRDEEVRRYYMSLEQQRRKENCMGSDSNKSPIQQQQQQSKLQSKIKENKCNDDKSANNKEDTKPIKQEGQKPTMETTGPPPPPTSQYYLHHSYMQGPHYGGLPFDPVYRGLSPMLVPGHYGPGPYLHPGTMPRYHAPEDLSRPPPPPKALDLLQHHASQYYSTTHKIHELQERALKSPTPKSGGSPGGGAVNAGPPSGGQSSGKPGAPPPASGGESASGKEARPSPPPQRHVHTHHHTHVGLGYPLYPAPYGAAAVLASQQAAVSVVNTFPPK